MTGLGTGKRVSKDDLRVEAYGCVDELNSCIGVFGSYLVNEKIIAEVTTIQNTLFDLGGELCIPGSLVINEADVTSLEVMMDGYNDDLPPLKEFVLPGGNQAQSFCHLARTVARRTERRLVTLQNQEDVSKQVIAYVNRLSDYLFVLTRVLAREPGGREILWQRRQPKS
jgi:cob(I)alamin adenosyltransferase